MAFDKNYNTIKGSCILIRDTSFLLRNIEFAHPDQHKKKEGVKDAEILIFFEYSIFVESCEKV
jgi:hypothetical protein